MEIDIPTPDLEEPCWMCHGHKPTNGNCDICKGSGKITTTLGDRVLDLVRRNMKILLADASKEGKQ